MKHIFFFSIFGRKEKERLIDVVEKKIELVGFEVLIIVSIAILLLVAIVFVYSVM